MAYYQFDLTVTGGINPAAHNGVAVAFFSNGKDIFASGESLVINGALAPLTINTSGHFDLTGSELVWLLIDIFDTSGIAIQRGIIGPYAVSDIGVVVP